MRLLAVILATLLVAAVAIVLLIRSRRVSRPAGPTRRLVAFTPGVGNRTTTTGIHQVPRDEVDGEEGWLRLTNEPQIGCVEAIRHKLKGPWQWSVTVSVMELVREDPLEADIRKAIAAELRGVSGVTDVAEQDREIWVVDGSPSGEDLVRATARAVDGLADRARDHLERRRQTRPGADGARPQ